MHGNALQCHAAMELPPESGVVLGREDDGLSMYSVEPVVSIKGGGCHRCWGEMLHRGKVFPRNEEQWVAWYLALSTLVPAAIARHKVKKLSINLNSDQILSRRIFDAIWRLQDIGQELGPNYGVMIEWTENRKDVELTQLWAAAKRLEYLRTEGGFPIIFDDVCSGEDSIGRMCMIWPDVVKVDGLIFQTSRHNKRVFDILQGQVEFYAGRNIPVVVEWIETAEDLRLATEIGATWGQGYYWTRGASSLLTLPAR